MLAFVKKLVRTVAYATPAHRWFGLGQQNYDQAFWDKKLATDWKPYLGGTVSVETRNAITLALIRMCAPNARTILDMGCASGALFRTPGGEAYSYTGVDISSVAIEDGRRQSPKADLHVARLEDFQPAHSFDVIVFNEVLYYLDIDMAAAQVTRYAEHLDPGGTILVSMKHDSKSGAVFRALLVRFKWLDAILCQEKTEGPDFAISPDSQRPAYLIAVLTSRSPTYSS